MFLKKARDQRKPVRTDRQEFVLVHKINPEIGLFFILLDKKKFVRRV
jgi:hypothetical protein